MQKKCAAKDWERSQSNVGCVAAHGGSRKKRDSMEAPGVKMAYRVAEQNSAKRGADTQPSTAQAIGPLTDSSDLQATAN